MPIALFSQFLVFLQKSYHGNTKFLQTDQTAWVQIRSPLLRSAEGGMGAEAQGEEPGANGRSMEHGDECTELAGQGEEHEGAGHRAKSTERREEAVQIKDHARFHEELLSP